MDATKPYEFIGFGAMDATKPYEFIGFGAMDAPEPYELPGGALPAPSLVRPGSARAMSGAAASTVRALIQKPLRWGQGP